jgi:hypothetical protein
VGRAREGEELTVRFPRQAVDTVTLRVGAGPSDVLLDELLVTVGGRDAVPVPLTPDPDCDGASCDRIGTLDVSSGQAEQIVVGVPEDVPGTRRVRVLEVAVGGPEGPLPAADPAAASGCGIGVLAVDGSGVPVRVAADDPVAALDQPAVPIEGCEPVLLADGEHTVDSLNQARIDQIVLATDGALPEPVEATATGTASARGPASLTVAVDGEGEVLVLSGQSHDTGWGAEVVGGSGLGPPIEIDGQSGWRVPADGDARRVDLAFGPQDTYRAALFVSLLGVAVCLVLALAPTLRRHRRPTPAAVRPEDRAERPQD